MTRSFVVLAATLTLAAGLLLVVAIVNGGPILYPDSVAYLIDGDRIVHLIPPYAVRPVFYGVPLWLLHWDTWFWPALFAQALVVAHLLWLTLRAMGAELRPGWFLLVVLALVLLTPVAWHVAHLLPDIFVAVLILALFVLGFCADAIGRWERIYLVLLAAAAESFHLTALPVGCAVLVVVVAAWIWVDRREIRPLLAALPLALGLAGSLAFNGFVWHRITLTPNSVPSLLARVLADGPGKDFLRARCPEVDFELCHYLDRLPATEDGFLWEMLPALPVADGKRIKAEESAVVIGTVRMFPWSVLEHMVRNAGRQLVTFGSETQLPPYQRAQLMAQGDPLARATQDSLQARGWFERPHLNRVNAGHAAVTGLSLVAAFVLLGRGILVRAWRAAGMLIVVLVALGANAAVAGALGGVFARYQGRVIWLLPFAVVAVWLSAAASGLRRPRTGFRTGSMPR